MNNQDPVPAAASASFDNLTIAPKLLEILAKLKFVTPTPIQAQSIPLAIEGKDLMGIAQTGTGKTLAFGIPMIQRMAQSKGQIKGLVVLPTRELALQVDATLRSIGAPLGLKTAILIGGESMFKQIKMLKSDPHVIIATPGRLIDHLDGGRLSLTKVGILVLDEADRMLDMGFAPQIKKIMERVPKVRQTLLFSATMPDEIVQIAKSYLNMPLRVEVAPAGSSVKTVTQELFFVDRDHKLGLLQKLLSDYTGTVLVFTRTKHGAKKITRSVKEMGMTAAEIHSNRTLSQRIEALEGFKKGKYRVMIATDIAARGIDVTGIQLVINYDLPATAEDYVHRIGRTGRAGMSGHAISFATADQRSDVRGIERLIKKTLSVSQVPSSIPKIAPSPYIQDDSRERGSRNGRKFEPRGERSFAPRGQASRNTRGGFAPRSSHAPSNRSHSAAPRKPFAAKSEGFGDFPELQRAERPAHASHSSRTAPASHSARPSHSRGASGRPGNKRPSRDGKRNSREPEYKKPSRPIYEGGTGYFMTRNPNY